MIHAHVVVVRNIRNVAKNSVNSEDSNFIYKPNLMTLCFLRRGDEVLLGRKTRKIGKGLWNGIGGNFDKGEDKTMEDAARREVKEEIGIEVGEMTCLGKIDFKFPDNTVYRVVMFTTDDYEGELSANLEEISELKWFDKNKLPLDEMLPADREFVPQLLDGQKVYGRVEFTHDYEIISCNIETIPKESDIRMKMR